MPGKSYVANARAVDSVPVVLPLRTARELLQPLARMEQQAPRDFGIGKKMGLLVQNQHSGEFSGPCTLKYDDDALL